MPEQWFAPHAAGFGPLVLRLAERDCPGAAARAEGDNAIRLSFEDSRGGNELGRSAPRALLSYCRGLFRILGEAPGPLERAAGAFAADPRVSAELEGDRPRGARDARYQGPRSFVLRSFGTEDPASLPQALRRGLEGAIARSTGARPDSAHPEREYRLQERASGTVLLLERVSSAQEPAPRPGELPRSTCRLLVEMAGTRADDVFLDPFCGYGGIALERALAAPYRFVFASDIDPDKIAELKVSLSAKVFEKRRKTVFPKRRDALDASAFEPGFLTAIATDPPWGLYEGGPDATGAQSLVDAFLAEAARALAPGGRLVLLAARSLDAAGTALALRDRGLPTFSLVESLDVLVSGKKAVALRLDRA
jgi:SAM-dependent methyltransferase